MALNGKGEKHNIAFAVPHETYVSMTRLARLYGTSQGPASQAKLFAALIRWREKRWLKAMTKSEREMYLSDDLGPATAAVIRARDAEEHEVRQLARTVAVLEQAEVE